MENSSAEAVKEVPVHFDPSAPQDVLLKKTEDSQRYEFTFRSSPITDEGLAEFDRLQNVKIDSDELGEQFFSIDDLAACAWYFDEFLHLTDGFDGDLPDDWSKSFSVDDKKAVVNTLLGHEVVSEESDDAPVRKFVFGGEKPRRVIKLAVFFDGEEIETSFRMPYKSDRDIKTYRRVTSKMVMKKGLSGTYLPETWIALGKLFDSMDIEVEGYEVAVPLHHKATVLREFFDAAVQATAKKSKS